MKRLTPEIIHFFHSQNFVIISTIDEDGSLRSSCKGIIEIDKNGRIYLLDLYKGNTFENLKRNCHISVTAVDEHKFRGYCLKGTGRIIRSKNIKPSVIKAWENRIASRITHRLLKNIRGEKGHPHHPETLLPKPEYMIVLEVNEIINLTPRHISDDIIYGAKRA